MQLSKLLVCWHYAPMSFDPLSNVYGSDKFFLKHEKFEFFDVGSPLRPNAVFRKHFRSDCFHSNDEVLKF